MKPAVTVILKRHNSPFFPWAIVCDRLHYSDVYETKELAISAAVARFGDCRILEK